MLIAKLMVLALTVTVLKESPSEGFNDVCDVKAVCCVVGGR